MTDPPLIRLRRLGGALVRRTDELVELLRRYVAPLRRVRLRYAPLRPVRRVVRPSPRRPHAVLSPIERAALAHRAAPTFPKPMIERAEREIPHPHARLHRQLAMMQIRRRRVLFPHTVRVKAAAVPTRVQVPAPPYYPRFTPIR